MMKTRRVYKFLFYISFILFITYPSTGYCFTLITPEEAATPDAPTPRGIKFTRMEGNGPHIKIHSPNLDEPLRIPFLMDIAFEASPDKIIDVNTLSIKYLKFISIDLTGRIKPFLNNNRLIVKDVKVPQGTHRLRLFIAYTSGEKTMMEIVLNIEK
jgi:hypothetical protein